MSILVIEQTFVTPKGLFQVHWIGEMEEDLEEIWKKLSLAGEESIVVMVEINSTDNWDQKAALTNGQSANHQAYHHVGNEDNDEKLMAAHERCESSECRHKEEGGCRGEYDAILM